MSQVPLPFLDSASFFREHAIPILKQSPEYVGRVSSLERLLRLGDRALAACVGDPDLERVAEVGNKLAQLSQAVHEPGNALLVAATAIVRDVEIWFKGVLWLAEPVRYCELVKANRARKDALNELRTLRDQGATKGDAKAKERQKQLRLQSEKAHEGSVENPLLQLQVEASAAARQRIMKHE
jgi:hypothetical protein